MSIKNLKTYKKELMKNKEFAQSYHDFDLQYAIIHELIKFRLENNITQEELSKRTGISKSNISRFESGKHSPTLKMLDKISKGLGKKISFTLQNND